LTNAPFRVIIPVALVKGKIHFHTGQANAVLMKALLEAAKEANGDIACLEALLRLPNGLLTALINSAARNGYIHLEDEKIAIDNKCVAALDKNEIDSYLGVQNCEKSCEFIVDFSSGLLHDFIWSLENKKTVNGITDVILHREIKAKNIPELLKNMRLRDLIRASSAAKSFGHKEDKNEQERKISYENIDYIDELELENTFDVAVPISEHSSGEITRWLLESGTPYSVVTALIKEKPELFKIKYELKQSIDKWVPCQAIILLDQIDKLWEKIQYAPLRSTAKSERNELAFYALNEINRWKRTWRNQKDPYSDAMTVDLWSGPAAKQGEELKELMKHVNRKLVILTSFLNKKYVSWVANILSNLPKGVQVLILYGHANPENAAEQQSEIQSYKTALLTYLRKDIDLSVGITTKRTHEKIMVSDSSNCLLGSWNICSSNPDSDHFEVDICLRSKNIALELCSILEREINENQAGFINSLRESLEKTAGFKGIPIDERIYCLHDLLEKIITEKEEEIAILRWQDWREQLLSVRDLIWNYFYSPKICLVETESLRDEFVQQIRSSSHSILIATDRVNYNGLDVSLIQHLFEKQRLIRIVWGMEAPEWSFRSDPEVQKELDIAADTLRTLAKHGNDNVLTSFKPMLNHSKLLIIDENRVLISSFNFLAKGNEPNSESSRDIGVVIESPLIARKLLGQFMLHSKSIAGPIDLKVRVGQPWDLFELLRQSVKDVWIGSGLQNAGRADLVFFAFKSNFLGFTSDGKIIGEKEGQTQPTDKWLNDRWEYCMRFYGKGRRFENRSGIISPYESSFINKACEMTGIQRTREKGTIIIRPRSKNTFIKFSPFWEKGKAKINSERKKTPKDDWMNEEVEIKNRDLYNLKIGKEKDNSSNADVG
jgi:phosphatidylserine/phosphatidylglycerophosphate/cardiolipin synthase-like enzyme